MARQVNITSQGEKVIPNTATQAVADPARNQAISASLANMTEKETLGYPAFSTLKPNVKGDIVFHDRKLWKFKQNKSAGAWDETKVEECGVADILEDYAKKDGYNGKMTVGLSENLLDTKGTGSDQTFIKRTSCGEESIADDGVGQIQKIKGNTLVWNQMVYDTWSSTWASIQQSGHRKTLTVTATATSEYASFYIGGVAILNHKYYVRFNIYANTFGAVRINSNPNNYAQGSLYIGPEFVGVKSVILTKNINSTSVNNWVFQMQGRAYSENEMVLDNPIIIDLTLMFGAGNEPSTTAEFEAMFPEAYYPANAGSMINNSIYSLDTIGFNRYDKTTGKADLVYEPEHGYQITGSYTALSFTGASGAVSTVTPDAEGYFNVTERGELTVTGGGADTCVHLCWSGYRDGEFEEYWKEQRVIDVTHLTSNGTVIFPDGLKRAGNVCDEIVGNKAIKRIGSLDLGMRTWSLYEGVFYISIGDKKSRLNETNVKKIICSKLEVVPSNSYMGDVKKANTIWEYTASSDPRRVVCRADSYSTPSEFKAAMSGVILYYELATPEEYDLDQELNLTYKVADFGSEEMNPIIDDNGNPASAPFSGVIKYNDDFTRTIVNLPENYVRRAELKQGTGSDTENPMSQKAVTDELETKADKVGTFDALVAGSAKALQGSDVKNNPSQFRTAGGSDDIASGVATLQGIEGQAIAWNQQIPATLKSGSATAEVSDLYTLGIYSSFSLKAIKGHKYYMSAVIARSMSGNNSFSLQIATAASAIGLTIANGAPDGRIRGIRTYSGDASTLTEVRGNNYSMKGHFDIGDSISYDNLMLIDLSIIYGLGNEPATVDEFEADYFKWFGKPLTYEAYDAGSLKNTLLTGLKTVGFNQYNPETGTAKVIGGMEYQIKGTYTSIELEGETVTPDANGIFTAGTTGILTVTGGDATTTCIHLVWSGIRNGQYEEYWSQTTSFDVTKVYGKLNGEGEYVQAYPDGMRKARVVYDSINLKDAVATVKVGSVDLGTLTWYAHTDTGVQYFYAQTILKRSANDIVCERYPYSTTSGWNQQGEDKTVNGGYYNYGNAINVKDSSYNTPDALKTSLSGVYAFFELATPLTYTDCVYRDNGVDIPLQLLNYQVDDFGTEEQTVGEGGLPAVLNILYGVNAVDALRRMPQNYISAASMDKFLAQLGVAMNGTWTKTWDATNGEYDFSFTPNEEPEQEPEQEP